jgi:hypothetical protein
MDSTITKNSWRYVSLSELGSVARGKSKHRPRNDSILYGGKYPFVQTSDIKHANFYLYGIGDSHPGRDRHSCEEW